MLTMNQRHVVSSIPHHHLKSEQPAPSNSYSPIFWTYMGQTSGNTVSLAANMETNGLPNDFCKSRALYPA